AVWVTMMAAMMLPSLSPRRSPPRALWAGGGPGRSPEPSCSLTGTSSPAAPPTAGRHGRPDHGNGAGRILRRLQRGPDGRPVRARGDEHRLDAPDRGPDRGREAAALEADRGRSGGRCAALLGVAIMFFPD